MDRPLAAAGSGQRLVAEGEAAAGVPGNVEVEVHVLHIVADVVGEAAGVVDVHLAVGSIHAVVAADVAAVAGQMPGVSEGLAAQMLGPHQTLVVLEQVRAAVETDLALEHLPESS